MMINELINYITEYKLLNAGDRILLGVSGGVDSMVLLDLASRMASEFGVSDVGVGCCNFSLRGEESDADQRFVEQVVETSYSGFRFHTVTFDTMEAVRLSGDSVQMEARRLRYEWFEQIARQEGYNKVVVAHHGGDRVETFFVNLMRGTGLRGMRGMMARTALNGSQIELIRPLLFAHRPQVEAYARDRGLKWREDSSNANDKYMRNAVRHNVIPELETICGGTFLDVMAGNMERLSGSDRFIEHQMELIISRCTSLGGGSDEVICIDIQALRGCGELSFLLFEILHRYGFSGAVVEDLVRCIDSEAGSGKRFCAPFWTATMDRGKVFVEHNVHQQSRKEGVLSEMIDRDDRRVSVLDFVAMEEICSAGANTVYFDEQLVQFPLEMRVWQAGDVMTPLGMAGRSKKVSDILVDDKVCRPDKVQQKVLCECSSGRILWLAGRRTDHVARVTGSTRRVVKITLID